MPNAISCGDWFALADDLDFEDNEVDGTEVVVVED